MFETIKTILAENQIDTISALPLSDCKLLRPYLLERTGIKSGTAFVFAVPYLSGSAISPRRNLSAYAAPRDYHVFFKNLFDTILPTLQEKYPSNKFVGFSDHSPIDEVHAAACASLGVIGDNHLLITEKYSSYVFLGEIITDAEIECRSNEAKKCDRCGACHRACPFGLEENCLSSLTQKKGNLSPDEENIIIENKTVWGCDACQETCPYTKKAVKSCSIFTPIKYFNQDVIPHLTSDLIKSMTDTDFSLRAYSWRGRDTIMRNLALIESAEEASEDQENRKEIRGKQ